MLQIFDLKETHSRTNTLIKQSLGAGMSEKEKKIRKELEMEIERDLEEEIKDEIYHHALRLHRFYQHKKERNIAKEVLPGFETRSQQRKDNTTVLLEVNISIRMEGGTKIEIKETKKEADDHEKGRPRTSRSGKMPAPLVPTTKKFDWVKTLRSNAGPAAIDRKNGSLHQAKTLSNNHCRYWNLNLNNPGRNGQPKAKADVGNKLLGLGWKN